MANGVPVSLNERYNETESFAARLKKFRKIRGLSQQELAEKLFISFQSVSKWENGNGMPSIPLLPALAETLDVSCDQLLGHNAGGTKSKYYRLYQQEDFFWTQDPHELSYKIIQMFPFSRSPDLLELGCGEGRDAVFFAMNRYNVTAIDNVSTGIDKGMKLAQLYGLQIQFLCSDIRLFSPQKQYDLIVGYRILHYLAPKERQGVIDHYKAMTRVGGVHIFTVCVDKPFLPLSPDHEETTYRFKSGELFEYYHDWELLYINEEIVDCNSSGIPHQHVLDTVIAKKIQE